VYVTMAKCNFVHAVQCACATLGINAFRPPPMLRKEKESKKDFSKPYVYASARIEASNITTPETSMNRCGLGWSASITSTSTARRTKRRWPATPAGSTSASRDAETVRHAFLARTQGAAKVCQPSRCQGNRYQVEPQWAGAPRTRFDPFDLSQDRTVTRWCVPRLATVLVQSPSAISRSKSLATNRLTAQNRNRRWDYLAALRAEYQARQKRRTGRSIHPVALTRKWTCPLTNAEA